MVKITDAWWYEIEDTELVLIHKFKKEKGVFGKFGSGSGEFVEREEEVGYFRHLDAMLERLAEIMVKEKADAGEIATLRDHIAELRRMRKWLHEKCFEA